MNGPTVLQTTDAPSKASVSAATSWVDVDDLVLDRVDARDVGDDVLRALLVAPDGDERDVELAQVLADQAAGVAGGAVDDDGLGHRSTSPFRRRPAGRRR